MTELARKGKHPDVKKVLQGRMVPFEDDSGHTRTQVNLAYARCCALFVDVLAGMGEWNEDETEFSNQVTESDEAFLIVVLENRYEQWLFQVSNKRDDKYYRETEDEDCDKENDEQDDEEGAQEKGIVHEGTKELPPKPKYCSKGSKSEGRKQGWSEEGKKRFDELESELTELDKDEKQEFDKAVRLERKKIKQERLDEKAKRSRRSDSVLQEVEPEVKTFKFAALKKAAMRKRNSLGSVGTD